jgi:hypothetical protein
MATLGESTNMSPAGKAVERPTPSVAVDKVIRDSFTMPVADYELIGVLKQRCIGLGLAMKKSELLRAGLAALRSLPDEGLARIVMAVESVKTGRPPGKKKEKRKRKKKKKKKKNNRAKRR